MNTSAPRILIVDDHPLVREGTKSQLQRHLSAEICGATADGEEAIRLTEAESPDLVIVDISLPGCDGLELIRRLGMRAPTIKTLVLSMHDETVYAERALQSGAKGYVSKREAPERLVEAVEAVLEGRIWLSEAITERLLRRVAKPGGEGVAGSVADLSDRELELFRLLGEGLTPREIAESRGLSIKTVEAHRENMKAKLGIATSAKLLQRAIEWRIAESGREGA